MNGNGKSWLQSLLVGFSCLILGGFITTSVAHFNFIGRIATDEDVSRETQELKHDFLREVQEIRDSMNRIESRMDAYHQGSSFLSAPHLQVGGGNTCEQDLRQLQRFHRVARKALLDENPERALAVLEDADAYLDRSKRAKI